MMRLPQREPALTCCDNEAGWSCHGSPSHIWIAHAARAMRAARHAKVRQKILARMHCPAVIRATTALLRRVVRAAVLCLLGWGLAAQPSLATELPHATDLARHALEATAGGKVLVVLYGTKTCPWCAKVRQNYLAPLTRNPDETKRIAMVEIDPETAAPLIDFHGSATDHRTFARIQGVRLVPTVQFYGKGGVRLADPLVGMSSEDFYGAYLNERLATAAERAKRMP
jgi:thioredoxin-related protein